MVLVTDKQYILSDAVLHSAAKGSRYLKKNLRTDISVVYSPAELTNRNKLLMQLFTVISLLIMVFIEMKSIATGHYLENRNIHFPFIKVIIASPTFFRHH